MAHRWSPSPTDAMSLAAIRWFACTLEALAIDIYATDRNAFPEIEAVLKGALKGLDAVNVKTPVGNADCPEGYELCDGLCRPACLGGASPHPRAARPPKAKKRR